MPEQPDLNWDNPEVEAAMHDVLRFWLDARGRRLPHRRAPASSRKDPLLRDNAGAARRHDEDWETIHDRLRGIRRVVDEYADRMIVGEVALQDLPRVVSYLHGGDQLHLVHNFVFAELPWDAGAFRDVDRRLRGARRRRRAGRPGSWPTTTCRAWPAASTRTGTGPRGRAPSR